MSAAPGVELAELVDSIEARDEIQLVDAAEFVDATPFVDETEFVDARSRVSIIAMSEFAASARFELFAVGCRICRTISATIAARPLSAGVVAAAAEKAAA